MHTKEANKFLEQIQQHDSDAKLYNDYSGRGMFGKTTTAVTSNLTPTEVEAHGLLFLRFDNLGLDYIYY